MGQLAGSETPAPRRRRHRHSRQAREGLRRYPLDRPPDRRPRPHAGTRRPGGPAPPITRWNVKVTGSVSLRVAVSHLVPLHATVEQRLPVEAPSNLMADESRVADNELVERCLKGDLGA